MNAKEAVDLYCYSCDVYSEHLWLMLKNDSVQIFWTTYLQKWCGSADGGQEVISAEWDVIKIVVVLPSDGIKF